MLSEYDMTAFRAILPSGNPAVRLLEADWLPAMPGLFLYILPIRFPVTAPNKESEMFV